MHGGVQVPLAAAAFEPAHAELAGALAILHLPEHRLDQAAAAAVALPPTLGAQLAVHPLARRHVLGHAPPRRRRVAQGGALLVVLPRGDDQFAVRGLAGHVRLGPVAGIRHRRSEHDLVPLAFLGHRDDVGLGLRQHRVQLLHVVGIGGDVGGEDDLPGADHDLAVVALQPAAARLHDAAVGVGDAGVGVGVDAGVGGLRLAATLALAGGLLL